MNLSPKLAWLAAMIAAPFAFSAGVTTTPVDLGTLGGSVSQANAINQSMFVLVGTSNLAGDANAHAFRQAFGGTLQDLGTLSLDPSTPSGNSSGNGVSAIGVAVGTSDIDIVDSLGNVNRYQHPYYFTYNTMFDVGTLGGSLASGNGISNALVVGSSAITGDAATHAFAYQITFPSGTPTDLGTLPGGLNSYGLAVNKNGVIAGASDSNDGTTHAVTWSGGTINDLGGLGGSVAQANAINSSGMAVGYGFLSGDSQADAWILQSGSLHDIGTLGGSFAQALAVNDSGVVVGSSNTAGDADVHAFVWTAKLGKMFDLNKLLPAGSPWDLQSANSISTNGTVVGVGLINGQAHAFSWKL